ncbi:MAG TPA: DUF1015 domain-containing protein [Candidatus Diapherotrites archaeon]|nr:DUF1015 domain-containing protein [Candidatus Diapherotrites archaeon]
MCANVIKNKSYDDIGLCSPTILLPNKTVDYTKWSVIAVDQYTSDIGYWESVKTIVGNSSSTFHIVFPEIYLDTPDKDERIKNIVKTMNDYLSSNLFDEYNGFIYVERKLNNGKIRKGLVVALDLEQYDFNKGSKTLIRATEGTILERLPPRIAIRKDAPLECPHIMVLIDDPKGKVIDFLETKKEDMQKLYDFELMMNGGHLQGYLVKPSLEKKIVKNLQKLASPERFIKKYKLPSSDFPILLYAMGDGNHSLATAKAIWEDVKDNAIDKQAIMQDPRRYALVELVNIHDESLDFEAIHRVLFNLNKDIVKEMKTYFGDSFRLQKNISKEQMIEKVKKDKQKTKHLIGFINEKGFNLIKIKNPKSSLPVGTLQDFLDQFISNKFAEKIDYVHGDDTVISLSAKQNNCGFYLPPISKKQFFKSVILDGALPRKTFSMGEANDKRFYMECRKIKN